MPYRRDLAFIHDQGFGHLAEAAAGVLLTALGESGRCEGTVVDFGCGSGITARLLADAGFMVIGFDLSSALIEIARKRAPDATFHLASFVDAKVPRCVAATAIGEVLNYGFDERNADAPRADLFARVFRSLAPGGVFLLDVAGPDRAPAGPTRTFAEHDDWSVLVEASAHGRTLTRKITTFRRDGGLYRRDSETHRLQLIAPDDIEMQLRECGFDVDLASAYGDTELPAGLHVFVARKSTKNRDRDAPGSWRTSMADLS